MIIKAAVVGLGSVNKNLLKILINKKEQLQNNHGISFQIVCVSDSSGVAVNPDGFDPQDMISRKEAGERASSFQGFRKDVSIQDILEDTKIDLVFEASPVDLKTGEPGLGITRTALSKGISVVLANKGPVALAYEELQKIATKTGASLEMSATVCGGLPILNIGRRDLIVADITKLQGIFNSTSNFILDEMATGRSYDDALAEAQERGIAEADPSLDVGGWDTANKLVIIANAILEQTVTLKDVDVTGIENITEADLKSAHANNKQIKLVAKYENNQLSVSPLALPQDSFLAHCTGWEMAVELHTDIYGIMYHKLWEREPVPTAASMLRDAVNIFKNKTY
ncbi:homoserine dehydrogenase [Kiloniella majae]|uniref:homoserine dehydrogenase n=1 Tax=Kiloniella majae TaxID=1938558 RepID=UPI000A277BD2|nr:homoserine dehydrogenase [Kiloniella majae]